MSHPAGRSSQVLCVCCKRVVPRLGSRRRMWKGLRRAVCAACFKILAG